MHSVVAEIFAEILFNLPARIWGYILAIILIVGISIYVAKEVFIKEFESMEILKPEIKLKTDGKIIDTIYVYKIK